MTQSSNTGEVKYARSISHAFAHLSLRKVDDHIWVAIYFKLSTSRHRSSPCQSPGSWPLTWGEGEKKV